MRILLAFWLLVGVACLGDPPLVSAMVLKTYVLGSGGDRIASFTHVTGCTLGQTVAATAVCPTYRTYAGYWSGLPLGPLDGVQETVGLPLAFELAPVHPNPLHGSGWIRYAVPRTSRVSLRLYDVGGRMVERLVDAEVPAGWHQLGLNGAHLGSGVFFCRMTAPGFRTTHKLVLMK
jgi:hypothetical protein